MGRSDGREEPLMDAPSATSSPPTSTAVRAGPPPEIATPPPAVAPTASPAPPSDVQMAWPRSAQWTVAALLGAVLVLLAVQFVAGGLRGSRASERGAHALLDLN